MTVTGQDAVMAGDRPLWVCPDCGRAFANAQQTHACATHELATHFEGRSSAVLATYAAFLALLEENGPVTVVPEKSRIAFQVRMSFAQLTLRRRWVLGHLVLARRVDDPEDPVFTRVETFSARNHVHAFRLDRPEEVERLRPWAAESYAVGAQRHLRRQASTMSPCSSTTASDSVR
jgi:hypothetical protein